MRFMVFRARLCVALIFVFVFVAQAQQLSFTSFHKSGIYELGEKAGWTVTLAQDTDAPVSKYTYVIKKNNLDVIQEGTLDLSAGIWIVLNQIPCPKEVISMVNPTTTT